MPGGAVWIGDTAKRRSALFQAVVIVSSRAEIPPAVTPAIPLKDLVVCATDEDRGAIPEASNVQYWDSIVIAHPAPPSLSSDELVTGHAPPQSSSLRPLAGGIPS